MSDASSQAQWMAMRFQNGGTLMEIAAAMDEFAASESTRLTTQEHRLASIVNAVTGEREYQDKKWGTLEQHPHTVGEWLLILESELAEAKQGWVKGKGDSDALREILQVVAVGFACLEQHGVVEREK